MAARRRRSSSISMATFPIRRFRRKARSTFWLVPRRRRPEQTRPRSCSCGRCGSMHTVRSWARPRSPACSRPTSAGSRLHPMAGTWRCGAKWAALAKPSAAAPRMATRRTPGRAAGGCSATAPGSCGIGIAGRRRASTTAYLRSTSMRRGWFRVRAMRSMAIRPRADSSAMLRPGRSATAARSAGAPTARRWCSRRARPTRRSRFPPTSTCGGRRSTAARRAT